MNGKVLEWVAPPSMDKFKDGLVGKVAGKHFEVFAASTWYEPKYAPIPTKIEDFSQEHRDYIEDSQLLASLKMFKVVALRASQEKTKEKAWNPIKMKNK